MSAKAKIIALMRECEQILVTEATVEGMCFDVAELGDAEREDKFEALRNCMHNVVRDCDELLD